MADQENDKVSAEEAAADPEVTPEAAEAVAEATEAAGEAVADAAPEGDADEPTGDEPAAEDPAAEEAPAEEPPAKPKREKPAAPPKPPRSPEERQAERDAARRAKAAQRSRRRQKEREKAKSRKGDGAQPVVAEERATGRPKVRSGTVVSDKADKTITVRIDVARRHRRYEKIVRSSSTLHAHDETNDANEGDVVRVVESRPLSRTKRWRLVEVLERAR
jgi:small subunit ribosomal protein S17